MHTLAAQQQSNSQESKSFENKSLLIQLLLFGATLAAFGAAAYYAHIARQQKDVMSGQWTTMSNQLEAMKDTLTETRKQTGFAEISSNAARRSVEVTVQNFSKDQRPVLWLPNDQRINGESFPQFNVLPQSKDGKGQIAWSFTYTNFGKAPANGIKFGGYLAWGERAIRDIRPIRWTGTSSPLPPGKVDFRTLLSDSIYRAEFDQFMRSDEQIVMRGKFEYTDSTGALYETGLCLARLATGATEFCPSDNANYIK